MIMNQSIRLLSLSPTKVAIASGHVVVFIIIVIKRLETTIAMNCLINTIPCDRSSKSVVSGAAWAGSVVPAGVKQRVRIVTLVQVSVVMIMMIESVLMIIMMMMSVIIIM